MSAREAIGADGFILYRHNYEKGAARLARFDFDKPCLTVTKQGYRGWDVRVEGRPGGFTVEDLKALCGFPLAFVLVGGYEAQWGFLGNAVMPLMMRAVSGAVRRSLTNSVVRG